MFLTFSKSFRIIPNYLKVTNIDKRYVKCIYTILKENSNLSVSKVTLVVL